MEAQKSAETPPSHLVPCTQYIYVKYAGHIGYSVCPSERRKGYATQMLRAVLPECKALGIDYVLISCLTGNEGSRKTIINNGGVYTANQNIGGKVEGLYLCSATR